jgi:hypothetical protein
VEGEWRAVNEAGALPPFSLLFLRRKVALQRSIIHSAKTKPSTFSIHPPN